MKLFKESTIAAIAAGKTLADKLATIKTASKHDKFEETLVSHFGSVPSDIDVSSYARNGNTLNAGPMLEMFKEMSVKDMNWLLGKTTICEHPGQLKLVRLKDLSDIVRLATDTHLAAKGYGIKSTGIQAHPGRDYFTTYVDNAAINGIADMISNGLIEIYNEKDSLTFQDHIIVTNRVIETDDFQKVIPSAIDRIMFWFTNRAGDKMVSDIRGLVKGYYNTKLTWGAKVDLQWELDELINKGATADDVAAFMSNKLLEIGE